MAWKPEPFVVKCEQCGWHKLYAPKSDVMMEAPAETCPKCGHHPLKQEIVTSSLGKWVGKLFGKSI